MKPKHSVASDKSDVVNRLPAACSDETKGVEFMEGTRWGDEPACPHCGVVKECVQMKDRASGLRNKRFLWRCLACKRQFTVRVGTAFEDSRIPMRHWCYGFWAACASKKGVSALQIKRMTGLSYKSALFMMHRIRFAMSDEPQNKPPLTGIVEADETYVGGKPRHAHRRQPPFWRSVQGPRDNKTGVLALVQRGGEIRPFQLQRVGSREVQELVRANVDRGAHLMTDEAPVYRKLGPEFAAHGHTMHSHYEYARGIVHSNTAESFFAILKRGIYGTFHSVSKKHLHRYLSEFQFRYNTRDSEDGDRAVKAIRGAEGKRLEYREQTGSEAS
jgi:transposase-like protein